MFKYGGYAGKILEINLTTKKISIQKINSTWAEQLIGGNGFAAKLLYEKVTAKTDALSQDNALIFMVGPLQGTRIPACGSRTAIVTKSPLTELFMGSYFGGSFGAELKYAGYDGIIITGKSNVPVYLYIKDDLLELRNAKEFWGLKTYETQDKLLKKLDEKRAAIVCIGPAGENQVKIACIISGTHVSGRGGTGAVMGSKNLKAIVVKGSKDLNIRDLKSLEKHTDGLVDRFKNNPVTGKILPEYGTTLSVDGANNLGLLGTRNWQSEVFEKAGEIGGNTFKSKYAIKHSSCFGCPIACAKIYKVNNGKYKGTIAKGPEYETIWALGSNCDNSDPASLIKANNLCDNLGIDTISAGAAIGLAMESYEKGIITSGQTGGIELKWGDTDVIINLVEQIGYKKDFGTILGEGTRFMGKMYGIEKLTCECKGLEIPAHSPRGLPGMAIGFATSNRGGTHQDGRPTAEKAGIVDRLDFNGKGEYILNVQRQTAVADCLICCRFTEGVFGITNITKDLVDVLNRVTGMNLSINQVIQVADRVCNIERAFNVREGASRKDDTLPYRVMNEPIPSGPSKGQYIPEKYFNKELDNYYQKRGWDTITGVPKKETLIELDLEYIAKDLNL